jgi:hypothetical protein
VRLADTSPLEVPQIVYSEELLLDYRWCGAPSCRQLFHSHDLAHRFDAKNIAPRFEFGFGLSYTTFAYSHLTIKSTNFQRRNKISSSPGGASSLYEDVYTISFAVKNSGSCPGNEVSQLYLVRPQLFPPATARRRADDSRLRSSLRAFLRPLESHPRFLEVRKFSLIALFHPILTSLHQVSSARTCTKERRGTYQSSSTGRPSPCGELLHSLFLDLRK